MAKAKDDPKAVLRRRVGKVSTSPGVYRWLDHKGDLLYVGKAKNLRKRMQSYVQKTAKNSAWTEIMVRQIADFQVTVVKSELEALMLESNVIKELKPKYNIMLKDDKGYVYVRVSKEEYPRVEVIRKIENDNARYFGPFTTGSAMTERTLEMLDAVIHFRSCPKSLDALNSGKEVSGSECLDFQIGRCIGLCISALTKEEYKERIKSIISFFRGNFGAIKRAAQLEMKDAAENKKFERAARIRDALRFIEDLEKRQAVSDTSGQDIDVFGIAERGDRRQMVILRQRDGKLIQELSFGLKGEAESTADALSQFLPQFYSDTADIPSTVIVREKLDDTKVMEQWMKEKRGTKVQIITPERGRKSALLDMAEKNAEEKVEQQFAAWEAETKKVEGAVSGLKKILSLPGNPKRIEGYDISHLGGTAMVGSMVVFVNGKPKRDQYRSFNISTVKSGSVDDYKALAETLRRRLKYLTADLKTMQEQLKEKGIKIRKAKKVEHGPIEATVKKHESELDDHTIEYKDFMVAEHEKKIVGFGRIHAHKGGIHELGSLFVDEKYRGDRLGHAIVRMLLHRSKAKKIYAVFQPKYEDFYAELGFSAIRSAPEVIESKAASCKKRSDCTEVLMAMYQAHKQKADPSFTSHPDLLLIDGGKGQLSTIVEVLKEMQIDIPVAGLAKREEEIFLPGEKVSVPVPKDSEAKFLLQRIRDEAHRFANSKREKRLGAMLTASAMDDMKGIGDITKKKLLKKFGSLDVAKKASDDELKEVLTRSQIQEFRKSG